MSTTLIESRKRGYDPEKLTDQQRMFVLELLASNTFSITEAARRAGYASPGAAAVKLLKKPQIMAALGKAKREREERAQLSGDDVLNYLRVALFHNPLNYFDVGEDGVWEILDPKQIPEEIGRLIESVEIETFEKPDGTTESKFKVRLVSKSTALALAMKHTTVEKHEVTVNTNWDQLLEQGDPGQQDFIERQIIEAESRHIE